MAIVFDRPKALADVKTHYCPGCTHGIIHRLVAEAIDALDIEGSTVGIAPVGCSVMAYDYFNCDMIRGSARPRARCGDRREARPPRHARCLPIRETATSPLSAPPRQCTLPPAGRI